MSTMPASFDFNLSSPIKIAKGGKANQEAGAITFLAPTYLHMEVFTTIQGIAADVVFDFLIKQQKDNAGAVSDAREEKEHAEAVISEEGKKEAYQDEVTQFHMMLCKSEKYPEIVKLLMSSMHKAGVCRIDGEKMTQSIVKSIPMVDVGRMLAEWTVNFIMPSLPGMGGSS